MTLCQMVKNCVSPRRRVLLRKQKVNLRRKAVILALPTRRKSHLLLLGWLGGNILFLFSLLSDLHIIIRGFTPAIKINAKVSRHPTELVASCILLNLFNILFVLLLELTGNIHASSTKQQESDFLFPSASGDKRIRIREIGGPSVRRRWR